MSAYEQPDFAAITVRRLNSRDANFAATLSALLRVNAATDEAIETTVAKVLADVQTRGDAAVLEYTRRFDRLSAATVAELELPRSVLQQSLANLPEAQRQALTVAAERVRAYHERQILGSWEYTEPDGTRLGQKITALDRVGLYVPGGKAAYPSSVLMNAVPAKVAGVDRVFTIGGAQAVAALAYGTETIPQVDKIVGPGNAYVAAAKRRVFGTVGIDMVAGPSEVLVIADGSGNPDWTAIDLFAQAEHDELAQAILLCPDAGFLEQVESSIRRLLPTMPRRDVIAASLAGRGALIQVTDLAEATAIANRIAPEHLELSVQAPRDLLPQIRHAGAIFLGHYCSESLGDYCAGPNHVLPTSRSARFSSPLGVYDFQKRSSIIDISASGAQTLGPVAATLAHGEGLTAHALAAELRLKV